jgi:hypothetical protein
MNVLLKGTTAHRLSFAARTSLVMLVPTKSSHGFRKVGRTRHSALTSLRKRIQARICAEPETEGFIHITCAKAHDTSTLPQTRA